MNALDCARQVCQAGAETAQVGTHLRTSAVQELSKGMVSSVLILARCLVLRSLTGDRWSSRGVDEDATYF